MTPEQVRELYDFNAWANHRTLEASSALSSEQFTRDLGSSYRSVRDTLLHIMGGEWLWLELWRGRSPSGAQLENEFPASRFTDMGAIRARWELVETGVLTFVRGVTAADLDKVVEYTNRWSHRFAYPLRSMLQHLVNHGTYHRGQVATMLRQLGATPRATDFLRYFDWLAGNPED